MIRRTAWALAVVGALLGGAGCKAKAKADSVAPNPAKLVLPIVVRPSADSNAGRPLYVVVRAIDEKRFIEDSYGAVAALVIEPDETVLATLVVFPGTNALQVLELAELPAVIGVYCLFTDTHEDGWKVMLEGVDVVDISVGATCR